MRVVCYKLCDVKHLHNYKSVYIL